ncbi:MAG: Gx transporter family protein [Spirochaetales bacterium]|nr:Gx transporter family protein [Spirochaetales bacterium]
MTRKATERLDAIAVLAALSLFLAAIEYMIPKPHFFRLGVANLAFLAGLMVLRPRELFILAAVKVVSQGLLFGTLFSPVIALSAAGSLAAALAMLGAHRLFGNKITLVGVSVCGAFASNAAQIAAAGFLLGGGVWFIAPPLLIAGTVTSVILGLMAERFVAVSVWVKRHRLVSDEPAELRGKNDKEAGNKEKNIDEEARKPGGKTGRER